MHASIPAEPDRESPSIAVVGLACHFPGADNPEEYWRNLREGKESISRFSMEELEAAGADLRAARDPRYVPARGILRGGCDFDAGFFGYSAREAGIMDPQHRVFLECAWEAMENAGYVPDGDAARTGVFAGAGTNTYLFRNLVNHPEVAGSADGFQVFLGNDKDFIPTRVSYKLNLRGPGVLVSTACSSSLTAVHFACQSLLTFQCDMALAGAVSIHSPEKEGYLFQEGGINSADGHCRAFDEAAGGTVGGCGAGIVVLKRLDDAIAAGDAIRAVIRGTAVNNDGAGKIGYTAPGVEGQAEVIAEAHEVAGIDPETISYIEAHGTGTALGDPIEIEALTRAFRQRTQKTGFCAIGSVKANLGHLDAAAGMAGLIKTILALENREIPATLHYRSPNPRIHFEASPFRVNHTLTPWPGPSPRRAGVSSFGIGGTNAHVVLEEAPAMSVPKPRAGERHVFALSARTPEALAKAARNLSEALEQQPGLPPRGVAFTLQTGRKEFAWRAAITAESLAEAAGALRSLPGASAPVKDRWVAFLFPGQGAQRLHMGGDLYRTHPVFRDIVDRCALVLKPRLGQDLRDLLYPSETVARRAAETLNRTEFAQPALFAVEYALVAFLRSLGIEPAAMIGHSFGEYTAACAAGVFTMEGALDLIATRASLMQELPRGAMLAVPLSAGELAPLLTDGVAIAATNGPSRTTVAGPPEAIAALETSLGAAGFPSKALPAAHAFHSPAMDSILGKFGEAVRRVTLRAPRLRYISNLTGTWITPGQATDPQYWVRHLRQTVRFGEGLACLLSDPDLAILEIGPGRELTAAARRLPECGTGRLLSASLHPDIEFADLVAKLWTAGVTLDWKGLYSAEKPRRVPLPTYPFERKRYYVRPGGEAVAHTAADAPAGDPLQWLYAPSWTRGSAPPSGQPKGPCLIFADERGLGNQLAALLPDSVLVHAGDAYGCKGRGRFTIHPGNPDHYVRLLADLPVAPQRIIHLWSFSEEPGDSLASGFYSVFHLLRAVGGKGAAGVRLHLVSNGVQDVTGAENTDPRKAALLAFVQVAPQEYPELVCRSIDVEIPASADEMNRLARNVAAEIADDRDAPAVAWRGRYRWVKTIEPLDGGAAENRPAYIRKLRSTWLVTGGTGGLALEFAEHLARTVQANLVLVARSPFSLESPSALRLPREGTDVLRQEIEARLSIRGIDSYPGLARELNALCCIQILSFLRERGFAAERGRVVSVPDLIAQLRVLPKFVKFVHYFLRILREDGIVRQEGDSLEFVTEVSCDWRPRSLELQRKFPGFGPTIELLDHCAAHFGRALSGETEAISVLFPDGKSGLMLEAGRDTVEHLDARVYRVLLKELLATAIAEAGGRMIRILEIGAGHGVLTGELLPVLAEANVEYFFTDLGKGFVLDARSKATERGLGFMKFQVLDITASPESQGLAPESFDFVFGLDVVHATPNIAQTLSNLRLFLRPGGTLALLETLRVARWNEMIFGLTEGWWYFEDPEIRFEGSPILSIENWIGILETTGYADVRAYPEDARRRLRADSGMLVARKPEGGEAAGKSGRIDLLRKLGSDVLVEAADVSDAAAMERVEALTLRRFGAIDGILHCAAVDDQGSIQWKNPRFAEMEFAPKILGTEVLRGIVERTRPSVFLLCSSLNTLTGGPGQIGYCAANSCLDAFAHSVAGDGPTRTVSVNWDRWQGIGMASAFEEWHFRKTGRKLEGGMTVPQGLAILDRILWADTPAQVIVSRVPPELMRRRQAGMISANADIQSPVSPATRPASNPPIGSMEIAIAAVFEATLGGGPIGRDDNFTDLGGDSLIAIQVISRLRENLQVELPLRSIFETPTVAGLAETVANRQWASAASRSETVEAVPMEEGVL